MPNLHVSKELMTVLARTQEWLKHSHAPRLNEKLESSQTGRSASQRRTRQVGHQPGWCHAKARVDPTGPRFG